MEVCKRGEWRKSEKDVNDRKSAKDVNGGP